MLVSTLNFVDRQIINILAEAIKVDLQLSDTQIGLLTGLAFTVFYCLLSLPAARLAERVHRPRLLGAAVIVWSSFTLLGAGAQSFLQLLLARMGVGVGESASSPTAHALIADAAPPERRTSALGLYQMGVPLGSLVGMALGGVVVDQLGWRMALMVVGAPGLLVGAVVALAVAEPRQAAVRSAGATLSRAVVPLSVFLRRLATKRSAWLILASASLSNMVTLGGYAFVASFFLRTFEPELAAWAHGVEEIAGLSMGPVAIVGIVFGVGSGVMATFGMYLGGRIADAHIARDVRVLLWIPAWAKLLGTPFAIAAMFSPSLLPAFGFYFVGSLMTGAAAPSVHTAMLGLVDARSRASVTSIYMIVTTFVGLGCGPLLLGVLSDSFNHQLGYGPVEGLRYSKFVLALLMVPAAALMALAAARLRHDYEDGGAPSVQD